MVWTCLSNWGSFQCPFSSLLLILHDIAIYILLYIVIIALQPIVAFSETKTWQKDAAKIIRLRCECHHQAGTILGISCWQPQLWLKSSRGDEPGSKVDLAIGSKYGEEAAAPCQHLWHENADANWRYRALQNCEDCYEVFSGGFAETPFGCTHKSHKKCGDSASIHPANYRNKCVYIYIIYISIMYDCVRACMYVIYMQDDVKNYLGGQLEVSSCYWIRC